MELYTPEGDYKIELFAGYVANGNEPFLRFTFNDETDFLTYIVWLKSRSTFSSSVDVKPHDRIITLATCSYEYDNARYVVFGKLIPRN
jgi:sortase B